MFKKLSSLIVTTLFSTALFATNGNMLISGSPTSKSFGGSGVSFYSNELDGMYNNPAILGKTDTKVGEHRFLFGLINTFSELKSNNGSTADLYADAFDITHLPAFGYFMNLSEKLKFGAGFFMLAASGQDFSKYPQMSHQKLIYASFKFSFNFAYEIYKDLWLGFSPDILYSAGETSKIGEKYDGDSSWDPTYKIGLHYQINEATSVGASFAKGADFELENNSDMGPLTTGVSDKIGDSSFTGVPDYYSVGGARGFIDNTLALILEYRKIFWSKTQGYDDLGLNNQDVYIIASQYKIGQNWKVRAGYNHAKKPLKNGYNENGSTSTKYTQYTISQQVRSAIVVQTISPSEDHFTAGVEYEGFKNWKLNAGIVISPKETNQRTGVGPVGAYDYKTTFKYTSLDLLASYTF